jgi:hypothetical protein
MICKGTKGASDDEMKNVNRLEERMRCSRELGSRDFSTGRDFI